MGIWEPIDQISSLDDIEIDQEEGRKRINVIGNQEGKISRPPDAEQGGKGTSKSRTRIV